VSLSAEWRDYVLEQLAGVRGVTARTMFGGAGLYAGGAIFGVMDDDQVFFKVDDATRPDYVKKGAKPWDPIPGYEKPSPNYYEVPGDILDDREELAEWARKAIDVGVRTKKKPAKKKGARKKR